MRQVLILSYYFPPLGMGGTQRIAKFVKYLPHFGWQPSIVTVKDVAYYAFDPTLQRDVRKAQVVRTGSMDPQRLLAKLRLGGSGTKSKNSTPHFRTTGLHLWKVLNATVLSFFLIPDSKILWLPFAISATTRLLNHQHFDAVITSSPPHSIHFAGMYLSKKNAIPWIADFRDGWTGGEFQKEASAFHKKLNLWLQTKVVDQADRVIGVSKGLVTSLKRCNRNRSEKFVTITNGFDLDDFKQASGFTVNSSKFVFCHSGAITAASNPEPFLRGLKHALSVRPQLNNQLRIDFVGQVLLERFHKVIKNLGLNINLTGYKSHDQAIGYLITADALLIIISDNVSTGFIPGKLFEYLGVQKPILAIVPPGQTASILKQSGMATIIWPPEQNKISNAILDMIDNKVVPNVKQVNQHFIQKFERRYLTEKLSHVLEDIGCSG